MNIHFGPDHEAHRRVLWPTELQNIQVEIPSSLLPHLSCNTALSALESNCVKELQIEFKAAEKLANDKIRRLQDGLAQAHAELGGLKKQVFACDIALAPIRALPYDILYQVFRRLPVYTAPPKIHIPTGLSHVSQSWRDVVFGMPHLWRLICLRDRHSIPASEGLLAHFGRLSGSLPLTIEIDEALTIQDNSHFQILRWVLTTWQDRNRLHTLGISMARQNSLIQEFLSLPDVPLSLQTLRHQTPAHNKIWVFREDASDVSTLLDRFPEMTALWLCVPQRIAEDIQTLQSWSKLTRLFLDMANLDTQDFWTLLQICPSLEVAYLTICISLEWDNVPRRSEVLVHNRLGELGLRLYLEGVNIHSALSSCCFPQVTSLYLEVAELDDFAIEDPVTTVRVFPSLQSLVLSTEEMDITQEVLRSILCPLSTITDLTILYIDAPSSLLIIGCLAQSVPAVYTEAGPVSSSYLVPSLSNICLHFSCHKYTGTGWDSDSRLFDYDLCVGQIMGLRSRPSLCSLSIECVQWPDDAIKNAVGCSRDSDVVDRQRVLERLCTELRKKLEEIDHEDASAVDVNVRVVEATGPFPPTPAVDHFLAYFS